MADALCCAAARRRDFVRAWFCDTFVQLCNLTNPLLMRAFITFMATRGAPVEEGLLLALGLTLIVVVMQPVQNLSFLIGGEHLHRDSSVRFLLINKETRKGSRVTT